MSGGVGFAEGANDDGVNPTGVEVLSEGSGEGFLWVIGCKLVVKGCCPTNVVLLAGSLAFLDGTKDGSPGGAGTVGLAIFVDSYCFDVKNCGSNMTTIGGSIGRVVVDEDVRDDGVLTIEMSEVWLEVPPFDTGVEDVLGFNGGGESGFVEYAVQHEFDLVVGPNEVSPIEHSSGDGVAKRVDYLCSA